jgi:hypothetical protein
MKKTVILLLTLALLAACLAGCGPSKAEAEFRAELRELRSSASQADSEFFYVCVNIRNYMRENGITANDNAKEFVPQVFDLYPNVTMDQVTDDLNRMNAALEILNNNNWGNKHAPEMIEQANDLVYSVRQIGVCIVHPKGTPEEYKKQYNEYDDRAFYDIEAIDEYLNN